MEPDGEKTMRYASAKEGKKITHLHITIKFKPKTSTVIL
jgi:hypothetical protein